MPVIGYASEGGSGGGSTRRRQVQATSEGMTVGMDPVTGFASLYEPGQLPLFYDRPYGILPDVFPGINPTGARYQALRDIGADPLVLYNLMVGNRYRQGEMPGAGNFVNWLANLYANLATPGGRGFNAAEMIRNVFNANMSEGGMTSLGAILSAGDAATQIATLFNLLRDATNVGMNPLAARGYQAALARAGDLALSRLAKPEGSNKRVIDLIRDIMPSLVA